LSFHFEFSSPSLVYKTGIQRNLTGKVREIFKAAFSLVVVSAIGPSGSESADQKRVMTHREAVGTDYLVTGRPITAHPCPAEALARILSDLES